MQRIMGFYKYILCLLCISYVLMSCDKQTNEDIDEAIVLNIEKNVGFKKRDYLKPHDLKIIPLDENNPDSFFKDGKILDVAGDTILLYDHDSFPTRILMFSLSDGHYLGEINHQGEGPGEYRFIFGAFVNPKTQSVIIPDIDKPSVYEYSLKNDSLIKTYERPDLTLRMPPIGNIEKGINIGTPEEGGLNIFQLNYEFKLTDSIVVEDFHIRPFISLWTQSGRNGIIFNDDILYEIKPGNLSPVVSLNTGKYKLDDKKAKEIFEAMIYSDKPDAESLKHLDNYMIFRDFQLTEDNILVTYAFDGKNYSDLYDLQSGDILYRIESETDLNTPNKIVLEYSENPYSQYLTAERLFTKDNTWYGIINETETTRLKLSEAGNTQVLIVSFKI